MGVHGLWKLLESSGKPIPLETLENKVLAVDVSIWLYQLVKGFQEKSGHSVSNAYLIGLFHRICKLLFYRIKPVFVFDGGVPALKRKTIAARQSNRSKAESIGEKLRISLLENLAKQEALGKALGESFVIPKILQPKQDTLFQLPPLPETPGNEENGSDSDNETVRYKDLQSIDITSDDFLSLPPDMRHDILMELKERRKENSWAKMHLMPEEGSEFSNFQMNRLLKRRAIQVGIEKAEGEMGTRGFTISDLQSILSEQGVELAQRIAADNTTKILYSGNLKNPTNLKDSNAKDVQMKTKNECCNKDTSFKNVPSESGSEDETEDDNLTQNEILKIIKSENSVPTDKDSFNEVSMVDSDVKMGEYKKLEVSKVVGNESGNGELKLEHGSIPQSNYYCQSSPLPSSSQPEFISDPESDKEKELADIKKFENNVIECFSLSPKKKIDDSIVPSQENSVITANKSSSCESNTSPFPKTKDENLEVNYSINSGSPCLEPKLEKLNTSFIDAEQMQEERSSSDDSNDMIEVDNDNEDIVVTHNKILDSVCSNNLIPCQIVINTGEQPEDDIFSDIFERNIESDTVELSDFIRIDKEDSEKKHIPLDKVNSAINETESSSHDYNQKLLATGTNYSNTEKVDQNNSGSAVTQLSIDEIIKMKKDLEQESDYLRSESSREDRIASTITEQITLDAQELLKLFGIPYIVAPMEAEAQCAFLDLTEQTQGTITDDSDIWLFGGKNVYKNFFDQKKFVQQFKSTDISKSLRMERDEMIMLALLSGSDYTTGLTGVGAVTALEIVAHFPKNGKEQTIKERLQRFVNDYKQSKLKANIISKLRKVSISEGFPSIEVIKAYLDPLVDQSREPFSWSKPNLGELKRYAREKFGWDDMRTDKLLQPVYKNLQRTQGQGTLHKYFEWDLSGIESHMSKRVGKAVTLLKEPSLLDNERNFSKIKRVDNPGCSAASNEKDSPQTVKSKTPAQIARERAARKIRELKKQGKFLQKSRSYKKN